MFKHLKYCLFAIVLAIRLGALAQTLEAAQATAATTTPPPTSREIPFDLVFSHLPYGSTQTITLEVWDAATGGNLIFSEVQTGVKVGFLGELNFVLGSQTPGGIPVSDFPSGGSRYLDIVDVTNRSVLLNGRIPLYARAFALTPGPAGPQGPPGPQGAQGPSGANGLTGATGPQGPVGSQGQTGAIGPVGPQGLIGPMGVIGPAGATGPQGPAGATGPQGPVGVNNRGVWSASNSYSANDAVSDGGSYWLALTPSSASSANPNTSCQPSSQAPCTTSWQLLAAAGAAGSQGAAGPMGSQGPQGTPGIPGPMGPPGTTPPSAALTTSSNTFAASQTVAGNLILKGSSAAIQFADGSLQTTAAVAGASSSGTISCSTFEVSSTSPVAPPGYTGLTRTDTLFPYTTLFRSPTPRTALAAAADAQGNIYAIGGEQFIFSGNSVSVRPVSTVDVYNPTANSWSSAVNMPTARASLAAAVDPHGNIYAIGGLDLVGSTNGPGTTLVFRDNVEVYNPATSSWSTAASLPTATAGLAAAADAQGNIYAIGGEILSPSPSAVGNVEVYNPVNNSWSAAASLPTPRFGLAAAVDARGNIYAIGGTASSTVPSSPVSTVEVYNPITNTWNAAPNMPTARSGLSAAVDAQGNIYAIGGQDANRNDLSTVEMYNPSTSTWSTAASLPARPGLAAASDTNGNIYALSVAGATASGFVITIDKYFPSVTIYTFMKE